jgi:hypothetical protein
MRNQLINTPAVKAAAPVDNRDSIAAALLR